MSDLNKILIDDQKEMLKLIPPAIIKSSFVQYLENSDSESESILPNTTSTPFRTKTATSKTTPLNRRKKSHKAKITEITCKKIGQGRDSNPRPSAWQTSKIPT